MASVTTVEKSLAIDRKRGAGGHARRVGGAHHERAEPPHLFLEQADGVVELVAAERVAADELGERRSCGRRSAAPAASRAA